MLDTAVLVSPFGERSAFERDRQRPEPTIPEPAITNDPAANAGTAAVPALFLWSFVFG